MSDWNSKQYLKFQKERTQPAIDLVSRIALDSPTSIIDIGCGPGNSSAVLQNSFLNAKILGVDYSVNMLERARKDHPTIDFRQLDASADDWKLQEKFDIVFSNACIQWIPEHRKLLTKMMGILNNGGKMAIQVPMNYEEPIHKIIGDISSSEKWHNKFCNPRVFYTLTVEEYYDILSEISSDFEIWVTTYCHRMNSHNDIIEWYKSTGLKPYLDVLNDEDKNIFISEVYNELKKQYPVQNNGEIIFRFPRLFFIAQK